MLLGYVDGMEAMASTIPIAATGSLSTPLQHAFIRALLCRSGRRDIFPCAG